MMFLLRQLQKITKRFSWAYALGGMCILISCGEMRKHGAIISGVGVKTEKRTPVSYEVYCVSFISCGEFEPYTLMFSQYDFDVELLIQPNFLLLKGDNREIAESLQRLLIEDGKKEKALKKRMSLDLRFGLLLHYDEGRSDTLAYINDSTFSLNNLRYIHYKPKIIKSLNSVMHIDCFSCKL